MLSLFNKYKRNANNFYKIGLLFHVFFFFFITQNFIKIQQNNFKFKCIASK